MLINLYTINAGYRRVSVTDKNQLNEAIKSLHHVSQFISMAGKAYLSHLDDDSHTNMGWDADHNAQMGRMIRGNKSFAIALFVKEFALGIINNDNEVEDKFELDGQTKEETENWLKEQLSSLGKDTDLLKWDLHYEIPTYEFEKGKSYQKPEQKVLDDIAAYRTNANALLGNVAMNFQESSEVRIWPHHFDTGVYIPYEKDEEGKDIKGIYAGWNIADEHVDEPYFYVTFFPFKHLDRFRLPGLMSRGYWHTKDFLGIFMKSTEIAAIEKPREQLHQAKEFFEEGVDKAIRLMKLK